MANSLISPETLSTAVSASTHSAPLPQLSSHSAPPPSYELQAIEDHPTDQDSGREFSLPPVDRGKDAWLCLMGGFFLEVMVWGFPFSFGVFQEYYTTHEPFRQGASSISLIGSCCMGIMYLASPFSLLILQRWPHTCRFSSLIGLVVASIGIVSSSFATRAWQLILTQGILYAIGACMLYYPILLFIDEWFVHKKGLAFGAGSGVAGVVFPFVIKSALSRFSFQTTMWAWTVLLIILVGPFLPFVKPRVRLSSAHSPRPQRLSFKFLRSREFLIFQVGNILQSLGYFAPSLYLPTYARSVLGDSGLGTTAPVTSMNAGTVIGFLFMGLLIDRWHVANVLFLAALATAVGVFVIWGFSVSLPPLCIFALSYGVFAGSSSATWPGIVKAVRQTDEAAPAGFVMGLLAAGRGIGSIACGPISEALIQGEWPWTGKPLAMGFQRHRPQKDYRIWPQGFYFLTTNIWDDSTWSDPVYFDQVGFDQDLFWDDDGIVYLSSTYRKLEPTPGANLKDFAIHICTVDLTTGHSTSGPKLIRESPSGVAEGSHIVKRGSYWYLFTAEGGTKSRHCEWVDRSAVGPFGPWEIGPHNPLWRNGVEDDVQNTGHADLLEAIQGKWWAVLLGVRPVRKGDKWEDSVFDTPVTTDYSLTERPNYMRIYGGSYNLSVPACSTLFFRKQSHHFCTWETQVSFQPTTTQTEAGTVVWWNYFTHSSLGVRKHHNSRILRFQPPEGQMVELVLDETSDVILIVECGHQYRFGYCQGTNSRVIWIGAISNEAATKAPPIGAAFTGMMLGLYAFK
ncbi:hypothetical protein NUU61_009541 [Penicillium alfredii]|uniref:Beta-xylosidase C-terminal Concanavalin A-like domain-containing protein n=1 Tax=Penicillium alfredii TaxID=1506179 RepID=A0A9W9EGG9_9EURO|nr:uncharacterized protein NUU61_009541 [Penicillium alfredii]KAJ5081277.1 hypothetical protein NUU61_009541 [Penicillium alfredii]